MFTFPRFRIRRSVLRICLCALGIVVLAGVIFSGWHVYERWSIRRLVLDGRAKIAAGDFKAGIPPLVKVIRENPKHVIATRMIAEALENLGSREALDFREKVLQLAPDSLEDALALTNSALAFENIPEAEAGIAAIRRHRPLPPDFLPPLLARLALLQRDNAAAEEQFSEALRLNPNREDLVVALAGVQVESDDPGKREAARKILQSAQAKLPYHLVALRGLLKAAIRDAANSQDSFDAYSLADLLVLEKRATFEDRLLRLTLLHQTKDSFYNSYLATLQKESLRSYTAIDHMVRWIVREGVVADCSAWLDALPPRLLKKPPLAKSIAEACLQQENWERLADLTTGEEWESLDYLRLAYLSIAHAQTGRATLSHETWEDSVDSAAGNLEKLTALLPLVQILGWDEERVGLLWKISEISPTPRPLLEELLAYHLEHRETGLAYRACNRLLKLGAGADNPELAAHWMRLSFLLNENTAQAFAQAAENLQRHPDSAEARTLLALAYLRQNRLADAYFLLRELPPGQLEKPYAATCYGIACAWLGVLDAGRYLNLGISARLFPEEHNLMRLARQKIHQDWLPASSRSLDSTDPQPVADDYFATIFLGSR